MRQNIFIRNIRRKEMQSFAFKSSTFKPAFHVGNVAVKHTYDTDKDKIMLKLWKIAAYIRNSDLYSV